MHSVLSQTHVVKLNVSCRLTHLYASTFMWSLCRFVMNALNAIIMPNSLLIAILKNISF